MSDRAVIGCGGDIIALHLCVGSGERHVPDVGAGSMTQAPQILLEHRLKSQRLPTDLREYGTLARQSATEGLDHVQFLGRLIAVAMQYLRFLVPRPLICFENEVRD